MVERFASAPRPVASLGVSKARSPEGEFRPVTRVDNCCSRDDNARRQQQQQHGTKEEQQSVMGRLIMQKCNLTPAGGDRLEHVVLERRLNGQEFHGMRFTVGLGVVPVQLKPKQKVFG